MKKSGMNIPMNAKNMEIVRMINLISLKAAEIQKDLVRGGSRALTVKTEKPRKGMIRKPMTRTLHPKPRSVPFSILDKATGMTIPPIEEPDITMPIAAARFLSKNCETAAIDGNCRRPITVPMRTAWQSINCQYVLHKLNIIIAKT
jgi:hypothetical protein